MPRASFKDTSRGGGFQEGRVLIKESYSTYFQYPPSKDGKQSDPLTAMVWKGQRLDKDGNELPGDENEVEIVNRMGDPKSIKVGFIEPKDFDNMDVEAKEVPFEIGAIGNSFTLDTGAKFGPAWTAMLDSLEAKGFKAEILGRLVAQDFEGMDATFKTIEGRPYIAQQDTARHKKGETVKPTNLTVAHIDVFPYDAKKKTKTTAPKAAAKQQQSAAAANANGAVNVIEITTGLFGKLSPKFKEALPVGKEIDREVFKRNMAAELMRQGITQPPIVKAVLDAIMDDGQIIEIAVGSGAFTTDGKTVTFL